MTRGCSHAGGRNSGKSYKKILKDEEEEENDSGDNNNDRSMLCFGWMFNINI